MKCVFVNVEQTSQICWKEDSKMLNVGKYYCWFKITNTLDCWRVHVENEIMKCWSTLIEMLKSTKIIVRIKYGERNHNCDKEHVQGNSINTTVNTR